VHRLTLHRDMQPRTPPLLTRHIHSRAGLEKASHHRLADVRWWDARPLQRFANHEGAEIHGGDVFQRAAEGADRRAARAEDHHLEVLIHPEIIVLRSWSR